MEKTMDILVKEPLVLQTTDYVYTQKPYWCHGSLESRKLTVLRPRCHFSYDPPMQPRPCVVWVCGGGWTEVDHNVWLPELTWLVKAGFVVASVDYSLTPTWFFPEPLKDIKLAIRWLRAHADMLGIDPKHMAVMGESAGGHLAALTALTGELSQFESKEYADQSDGVQAAVCYYPCVDMADFEGRGELDSYDRTPQALLRGKLEPQSIEGGVAEIRKHPELAAAMDPRTYITPEAPPFLMMHGTCDSIVPIVHSERLYAALTEAGIEADFIRVQGADHADYRFYQQPIRDEILSFLKKNLCVKD